MKIGCMPCTQDSPRGERIARILDELLAEACGIEAAGFDGDLAPDYLILRCASPASPRMLIRCG